MSNILVTVDGIDGVGKSTVCKSLSSTINNAVYFKSPSEPFQTIRKSIDADVDPVTRYYFYRSAVQHDSNKIRELLENKTVICDRYVFSTFAYHLANAPEISKIMDMQNIAIPDYAFVLTAPIEECQKRIINRGFIDAPDRKLEKDIELQSNTANIFNSFNLTNVSSYKRPLTEIVNEMIEEIITKESKKWLETSPLNTLIK